MYLQQFFQTPLAFFALPHFSNGAQRWWASGLPVFIAADVKTEESKPKNWSPRLFLLYPKTTLPLFSLLLDELDQPWHRNGYRWSEDRKGWILSKEKAAFMYTPICWMHVQSQQCYTHCTPLAGELQLPSPVQTFSTKADTTVAWMDLGKWGFYTNTKTWIYNCTKNKILRKINSYIHTYIHKDLCHNCRHSDRIKQQRRKLNCTH